jgi:hypothetical protein
MQINTLGSSFSLWVDNLCVQKDFVHTYVCMNISAEKKISEKFFLPTEKVERAVAYIFFTSERGRM